jgi:hypothetical protein
MIRIAVTTTLLTTLALPAAALDCGLLRFAPGTSSGTVAGTAPAEGILCYSLEARPGQTARVEVLEGRGVAFNIQGIAENAVSREFAIPSDTLRIDVYQTFRAPGPTPFRLHVAID